MDRHKQLMGDSNGWGKWARDVLLHRATSQGHPDSAMHLFLGHADSTWQNAYLLAPHLHRKPSNLIASRLPQLGAYTSLGHMMESDRVQTRLCGVGKSLLWCKRGPEVVPSSLKQTSSLQSSTAERRLKLRSRRRFGK